MPGYMFLVMLALLVAIHAKRNLIEPFPRAPNDGFSCTWYEGESGRTKGSRSFRVVCKKQNQDTYECTYRGNPHNCASYNKKNHQRKYYDCLSEDAARQTGCTKTTLVCDKRPFTNCDDVKFNNITRLPGDRPESLLFERMLEFDSE